MSTFVLLWTLSSSLFFLIPAIIFRLASLELLFKPVVLVITADWILLGLVQWRLLNPYLSKAYTWGVVTIVSGIIISVLWVITIGLGLFIFGLTAFSNKNFWVLRFLLLLVNLVAFFALGYLFGWIQIQVLKQSIVLNEINYFPWKMAFYWLGNIPISLIASVAITTSIGPFPKYTVIYLLTTLITVILIFIINLIYASKLEQILTTSSI
jgi:hypothetical protein